MTKTDKLLFQAVFISLGLIIIAISLQNWRTCAYRREYRGVAYDECIRDGFFKFCYSVCTIDGDLAYNEKCKPIPWNVWGRKTDYHRAWVILMFMCLITHILSFINGAYAILKNSGALTALTCLGEILAGSFGIASMSVFTDQYDHPNCAWGASYYFGWTGSFYMFFASMMFFAYFGEQNAVQQNTVQQSKDSEKTRLI